MRTTTAIPVALLGAITAVAVATGCGVDSNDTGNTSRTVMTTGTSASASTVTTPAKPRLPTRPAGTIAVDTVSGDPVTGAAIDSFSSSDNTNVNRASGTDANNFAALCAGRVDAITVTREPNGTEAAACKRNEIELAAPIETASDAIVLATKNASDVGGDCITVRQARDIYRAGSGYSNWSELGFDDLPLRTTGREQGSAGFQLFGQIVLGIPNPTLGDVRSDYVARTSDLAERETVTGAAVRRAALSRIRTHNRRLVTKNRAARARFINRQIAKANTKVLRLIAKVNARNKRKKVIVNGPKLIRDNARLVANAKRIAGARAAKIYGERILRLQTAYTKRALRGTGQRGYIGPFRFSYYGLFEQQLRPMEIDYGVPETASSQPVQFQDLTVADQQALAGAVGRATGQTTRTPAPAPTVTTATTTVAGKTVTAKSATATAPRLAFNIEPTTIVPPLDNLPATTRDGSIIYSGPNCVFPSSLTITNGSYPLSQHTTIYTTKTALKRAEVRRFLTDYVMNAQALARDRTLIPITNIQRDAALREIRGQRAQKVAPVTGSEAPVTTPTNTITTRTVPGATRTTPGVSATTATTRTTTTATPTLARPNAGDNSGVPGVSNRDPSSRQ